VAATTDSRERLGREVADGLAAPADSLLREAGHFARFCGQALLEVGSVWRYTSEVLRQASILLLGSVLVISAMEFVVGLQCATEGDYALRAFGASSYSGVLTAYCGVHEMGPFMFGYIAAAKIGCGYVAEIGSMRISEELDAMESVGVSPMRYVVATRLVAAWLAFPLIYIVALGAHFVANYVVIGLMLKTTSVGAWATLHWAYQSPMDLLYSELKVLWMGTAIVLVSMYFGWRAKGGPVGVGRATANSMIVNLVLVHIIGSVGTAWFWGVDPRLPTGG